MKERNVILVISDIHLGSEDCNEEALLVLLEMVSYKKLIIVGDLMERNNVISKEQFKVIEHLSINRERIVCIDGNHDPLEEGLVQKLLGRRVVKKYEWLVNNKKFCALHGHQFDHFCFIFNCSFIDKISLLIAQFLRKVIKVCFFEKFIGFLCHRNSLRIAKKAKRYAKRHNIDVIICGHTHQPMRTIFYGKKGRKIEYFNCGSFSKDGYSFVTIDEDGRTELHLID